MHRARAANSTWLIVLLSIQACGDDPAAPPPEPSSVAVEPQGTVLRAIGDTVRFRARAVDTDGNVMTTATFNWSVSDAFIASVDAQGLVTAVAPGAVTVRATVTGSTVSGTAPLSVEQLATTVEVTPAGTVLRAIGDTARFAARAVDARGNAIGAANFTWSVQEASLASVDAQGLVTALAPGSATVRATVVGGSANGAVPLTIQQDVVILEVTGRPDSMLVGGTAALVAATLDRNRNPVANVPVTWSSSADAVATVSGTGVVTAVGSGTATIRAAAAGLMAESGITVRRPNVDLTGDTVFTGTVQVRSLTIPDGVTVTSNGALTIDVEERASIRGTLVSDCRDISVYAGGPVDITGTVQNSCTDSTATVTGDLTIAATDSLAISGLIQSTGRVYITNDTTLGDADFPPMPPADSGMVASSGTWQLRRVGGIARGRMTDGLCVVSGQVLPADLVRTSVAGGDGVPGGETIVRCSGRLVLDGAMVEGQYGQHGSDQSAASSTLARADGSNGGAGGAVRIEASGDIVVTGTTRLATGRGGDGGGGFASGTAPGGSAARAADAEATGGHGGAEGLIRVLAIGGAMTGTPSYIFRGGGRGGHAWADGAKGRDGNESESPQAGGNATSVAGTGGAGALPGTGGQAQAVAGAGGRGSATSIHGAPGGLSTGTGGRGGRAVLMAPFALGTGGTGGEALFNGGRGGDGHGTCGPPATTVGGDGGRGGSVVGRGGEGGPGSSPGETGRIVLIRIGNGGNAGAGITPGSRGAPGTYHPPSAPYSIEPPSLQPGEAGETCPVPITVGISLSDTELANTHVINSDPCPQLFGSVTLTNTGNTSVSWNATLPPGLGASPSSGSLSPGQSRVIQVFFTCQLTSSFTGRIIFTANGPAGSTAATAELFVTATVQ